MGRLRCAAGPFSRRWLNLSHGHACTLPCVSVSRGATDSVDRNTGPARCDSGGAMSDAGSEPVPTPLPSWEGTRHRGGRYENGQLRGPATQQGWDRTGSSWLGPGQTARTGCRAITTTGLLCRLSSSRPSTMCCVSSSPTSVVVVRDSSHGAVSFRLRTPRRVLRRLSGWRLDPTLTTALRVQPSPTARECGDLRHPRGRIWPPVRTCERLHVFWKLP